MYVKFFVFIFAILREHIRNGAIDDQKQGSEAFSISSDKQQNVTCDGRGKNLKKERNVPSTANASPTSEAVATAGRTATATRSGQQASGCRAGWRVPA